MKWSAILVGGACLLSASLSLGESRTSRVPGSERTHAKDTRSAAGKTGYFLPAVPMPIPVPVVVEPRIIRSQTPIAIPSDTRATTNPTFSVASSGCAPLQISVPEGLLNRFLADERSQVEPVRDVIAKADVIGRQLTATRVVVDVKPNNSFADLQLVLTGDVHSDTIGLTSQAAVKTLGRHDVLAVKPVMFDGYQITTKKPRVWVDVHNEHVAAATPLDGTLFAELARSTAIKTVRKKQSQIDAETAERLSAQLGPQFNREADRRLAQFNREWRDGLRQRFGNLWPQRLSARSTETEVVLAAAWADAPEMPWSEISRNTSTQRVIDHDAVTVWLHESVVNAWLRNLDLGGKTMTEAELRGVLESFVTRLGGRVLPRDKKTTAQPLPGAAPQIRLADKNPVRVTIADGQVRLIVVASIEVAGQTVLAQDEITLPWTSKLAQGDWRLIPGQLVFAKADTGVSLVGMVETMARTQLAAAIPEITFPETIPLPLVPSTSNQPLTKLRLAHAEAKSGWLEFSLAVGSTSQPIPESQFRQPQPDEYVPVEQFRSEPIPVSPPRLRAPTDFESRRDHGFFR